MELIKCFFSIYAQQNCAPLPSSCRLLSVGFSQGWAMLFTAGPSVTPDVHYIAKSIHSLALTRI